CLHRRQLPSVLERRPAGPLPERWLSLTSAACACPAATRAEQPDLEPSMDLKPQAFRLMRDSDLCSEARAGTTVYSCILGTYGVAAQDTRMTGRRHRCVTLDPEGGYPFFTVPEADLILLGCDHER